jgi:type I restriction enzyme S subunit
LKPTVDKLPENWEWTNLGNILSIVSGEAFKKKDYSSSGVRLLQIANVSFNRVIWEQQNFLSEDFISKYPELVLQKNDIVMALNRPLLNGLLKIASLKEEDAPAILYQRVARFNLFRDEMREYFLHYPHSPSFIQLIRDNLQGSDQPYINTSTLPNLPIPIPPLNEQRRIVAKIEALKARSQRVKEELEAIAPLLDQFRQSVLAAAFRGDLTADWREKNPDVEPASVLLERTSEQLNQNLEEVIREINKEPNLIPNSWGWTKLKLIVKNIQAGKNFSCPEVPVTEDTVGLVKISAVSWGKFDDRETKTVIDYSKIDPNLFIHPNDFLISRANTIELVGASVVVEEIKYKIMLSDKVWRVDFLEVDKKYINFYLKSAYGRKEIESRATGNQLSMRNISQNAFRDIVIALPPLKEQQEIVCRIETFFKTTDQVKQQYQEAKAYLDKLNQSILAKAFRGELVRQDPNDEPASVLLERIRAEREKLDTKKKTKGKSEKKSRKAKPEAVEPEQLSLPGLE